MGKHLIGLKKVSSPGFNKLSKHTIYFFGPILKLKIVSQTFFLFSRRPSLAGARFWARILGARLEPQTEVGVRGVAARARAATRPPTFRQSFPRPRRGLRGQWQCQNNSEAGTTGLVVIKPIPCWKPDWEAEVLVSEVRIKMGHRHTCVIIMSRVTNRSITFWAASRQRKKSPNEWGQTLLAPLKLLTQPEPCAALQCRRRIFCWVFGEKINAPKTFRERNAASIVGFWPFQF